MLGLVVSFVIGYAWGKLVMRTGSWIAAGAHVAQLIRQVLSGIVARLTQPPPAA